MTAAELAALREKVEALKCAFKAECGRTASQRGDLFKKIDVVHSRINSLYRALYGGLGGSLVMMLLAIVGYLLVEGVPW